MSAAELAREIEQAVAALASSESQLAQARARTEVCRQVVDTSARELSRSLESKQSLKDAREARQALDDSEQVEEGVISFIKTGTMRVAELKLRHKLAVELEGAAQRAADVDACAAMLREADELTARARGLRVRIGAIEARRHGGNLFDAETRAEAERFANDVRVAAGRSALDWQGRELDKAAE